jgi:ADP-glucose pyrophosphorylase
MVLAGGEGKRLQPLTADRAKPAVPFGGNFRLVDFALSNLVNAGFYRIAVLTQYKSHSLDRHIATSWRLSPRLVRIFVLGKLHAAKIQPRILPNCAAVAQKPNQHRAALKAGACVGDKPDFRCTAHQHRSNQQR